MNGLYVSRIIYLAIIIQDITFTSMSVCAEKLYTRSPSVSLHNHAVHTQHNNSLIWQILHPWLAKPPSSGWQVIRTTIFWALYLICCPLEVCRAKQPVLLLLLICFLFKRSSQYWNNINYNAPRNFCIFDDVFNVTCLVRAWCMLRNCLGSVNTHSHSSGYGIQH